MRLGWVGLCLCVCVGLTACAGSEDAGSEGLTVLVEFEDEPVAGAPVSLFQPTELGEPSKWNEEVETDEDGFARFESVPATMLGGVAVEPDDADFPGCRRYEFFDVDAKNDGETIAIALTGMDCT